ncbi:MAG: cysteine desulfurase family protein [Bacteroidota bacterium]
MRVYLDNAATTPISPAVITAMTDIMQQEFGNPSSIHAEGRKMRAALEKARKTVAQCIGASIGEIFFTSGGTESNNMALKCAVRDLGVKRIISSTVEHHCVLHTLDRLAQTDQIQVELLAVDHYGRIDYAQLESLLQDQSAKTLVSLMHANNEIGVLLDMERVANLCQTYEALFHSDTVQTVGHFPINVSETPISFLSGAAHKFHGPKGIGFIYINGNNIIQPFIDGGAQERNMRGGTENVYGIVGLAKALDLATTEMEARRAHISSIRTYLADQLQTHFKDIQFNTDLESDSLYTVLSVSFPPTSKSDLMLLSLDIEGISVSGGSACSSGADAGSHVINALNADPLRKTIRFSFSHYNTQAEIDYVIEKLKRILPEIVKEKEAIVVNA